VTRVSPSAYSLRQSLAIVMAGASPVALVPLLEWWMHSPFGFRALQAVEALSFFAFVLSLGLPIVFLIGLFLPRSRRKAAVWLLAALVFPAAYRLGGHLAYPMGEKAFRAFVARPNPLPAAIRAYTTDRGAPPATLDDLVPGYLPAIPTTGLGAWPDYRYEPGTEGAEVPWRLVVRKGKFFQFDDFSYYGPHGCDDRWCVDGWVFNED
jgi:hypothetical protein